MCDQRFSCKCHLIVLHENYDDTCSSSMAHALPRVCQQIVLFIIHVLCMPLAFYLHWMSDKRHKGFIVSYHTLKQFLNRLLYCLEVVWLPWPLLGQFVMVPDVSIRAFLVTGLSINHKEHLSSYVTPRSMLDIRDNCRGCLICRDSACWRGMVQEEQW